MRVWNRHTEYKVVVFLALFRPWESNFGLGWLLGMAVGTMSELSPNVRLGPGRWPVRAKDKQGMLGSAAVFVLWSIRALFHGGHC